MPNPNPYDNRIDDYLNDYQGQYDPLFQQQRPTVQRRVPSQAELQKQKEESVIRRTIENVKEKTLQKGQAAKSHENFPRNQCGKTTRHKLPHKFCHKISHKIPC